MADNALTPATTASTPQQEVDALIAMVQNLSQLSLDMTRLCIDVQNIAPGVALSKRSLEMTGLCLDVKDQIQRSLAVLAAAATVPAPPTIEWVPGKPLTPDQLQASHPKGLYDESPYHVVCIGREPGLYISSDDASVNVSGVPGGFRKKKDNRLEALAFYATRFDAGQVKKWRAVPIAPPAVADSSSAAPASPESESPVVVDSESANSDSALPDPVIAPARPRISVPVPTGWVPGDPSLVRFNTGRVE